MDVKDETVETQFHPILTAFLFRCDAVYRGWERELIITSGSEHTAKHSKNSLHYALPACAADIRSWSVGRVPSAEVQVAALEQMANQFCLGLNIPREWIEIILETTHIHIEFQPKRQD